MKKASPNRLASTQQAEIDALATLPEEKIRTDLIPEQRDWSDARRGGLFRPIKKQITLRLDADVLEWFRGHPERSEGYQTSINRALREYMTQHHTERHRRSRSRAG